MPYAVFRSIVFNILFFALTAISCVVLLPTLLLPRKYFMAVVHGFVHVTAFLEKYVLGLRYEIRGREHIPENGAYIVAAKHQSAYETLKLHILFKDPAIVLKKELLSIPLWGQYLAKSDVIAIDRSTPKSAIKSIQDGAKRMAVMGREIVIFPQGTRVFTHTQTSEKPYKIGIVRIQEATNLPIIPLALNTGYFHPRNSFFKRSGCVVFEFLPAIMPGGEPSATLSAIENALEPAAQKLVAEAEEKSKPRGLTGVLILPALIALYCGYWFAAAHLVEQSITRFINDLKHEKSVQETVITPPRITGFPLRVQISFDGVQSIQTAQGLLSLENLVAQGWPFIGAPVDLSARNIILHDAGWQEALTFDFLNAQIAYRNNGFDIHHADLDSGEFKGRISGFIAPETRPYPEVDLVLELHNHPAFIMTLAQKKIIKEKPAMFAMAALTAMQRDGVVVTSISRQDNVIYLGPLRVLELPQETTDLTRNNVTLGSDAAEQSHE